MVADEEIERLRAVPPASLETLAMRVRDPLWGALVHRTDRQCPRYDSDRLRAPDRNFVDGACLRPPRVRVRHRRSGLVGGQKLSPP